MKTIQEKNGEVEYVLTSEEYKRLHEANQAMLEALKSVWLWMENQADNQSKGGHATFDLMMLREERDKARAAIAKGEAK